MALIQILRKEERLVLWLFVPDKKKKHQMSAGLSRSACAGFREIQFRFLLMSY